MQALPQEVQGRVTSQASQGHGPLQEEVVRVQDLPQEVDQHEDERPHEVGPQHGLALQVRQVLEGVRRWLHVKKTHRSCSRTGYFLFVKIICFLPNDLFFEVQINQKPH